MSQPITVQVFFPFGNKSGVKILEYTTSNILGIVIPRKELKTALDRAELKRVGLYFLVGEAELGAGQEVYIGESENVGHRLSQHNAKKDFWQYAIAFVGSSHNRQMNKSDVKYLERLAFDTAKNANRYQLNQTIPTASTIQEWREADMSHYLDQIKLMLSVIGFPIFENLNPTSVQIEDANQSEETTIDEKQLFYNVGTKARGGYGVGIYTSEGMLVLKKSRVAKNAVPSFQHHFPERVNATKELIAKGILQDIGNEYEFTEDYLFSSPSGADAIIQQMAGNGWKRWKNKEGKTLGEIYR